MRCVVLRSYLRREWAGGIADVMYHVMLTIRVASSHVTAFWSGWCFTTGLCLRLQTHGSACCLLQLAESDADARRRRAQLFGSSQAEEVDAMVSQLLAPLF